MSIDSDSVQTIIEKLASCYPEYISGYDLEKEVGNNIGSELTYCKEKNWVVRKPIEQWRATAKGVDASMIMENKDKSCFQIGDC